jgi:Ca-activated chloride channel family protein
MLRSRITLPIVLALLIGTFTPSIAQANDNVLYYILDASGSMWQRVEGKPRITIAKETLARLLEETPANVRSGVTVYGHRRRGDCADIEEIIALGPMDAANKARAQERIRFISARGKTPITDSIQLTIDRLRQEEGESTIVLVSDGLESCGKDPCALTQKLKASGIKFVMHVVGFGLMDHQVEKLSCIADAGGGAYFTADTAGELLDALKTVKQSVVEQVKIEKAPEPEPIEQEVASSTTSIKIKAKGPGTVKLVPADWVQKPRYWALADPETGEEVYQFKRQGMEPQLAPSGVYQLAWRQTEYTSNTLLLGEIISVKKGETTEVPLQTGIRLNLPQWVERPRWWGLQSVSDKPGKPHIWYREFHEQLVLPGSYQLLWHQVEYGSGTVNLGAVEILPDQLNQVTVASAIQLVRADWVPEKVKFWRLIDAQDQEVAWFRDYKPNLVPAGTYRVVYRQSEHGSTDSILGTVEITAGELTQFPLNTGVAFIPQEGAKAPRMIKFIQLNKAGEPTGSVQLRNGWGPMPLAPGTYRIDFQAKNHGPVMTIVDSFDLPAGALVEIEM